MASVRQDRVQVEVEINGKKAGETLKDLKSDARQLARELENLTPGTEAFNAKAAELRAARARVQEVNAEVNATGQGMTKLQQITGKAKEYMAVAFAAIAAAAVAVGTKIAEIVIQSEQVDRKFKQVFGDAAGQVDDFAKRNANSLGITTNEFKNLASASGDLLVPLGLTRTEAAKMSNESVKLAGALSQWTNGSKSVAEVSEILTKAMLGEKDGLQQLGIKITEAEVSALLLERGQSKLTGTMLEQSKALAINELILRKSQDAQNAFENGADTMAQKVTKAKAKLTELWESIAKQFAPVVIDLVNVFGKLTGAVSEYGEQKFSDKLNEERVGVNALVRSITQQNEGSALRTKLIGQLQAQYPNFLGNLDAEKATNEQLLGRLKEVNEEYKKKIMISAQDEIVKEVLDRQKQALVGLADATKQANKGFMLLNEAGANIDLNAPLEKQFQQYVALTKQWKASNADVQDVADIFFGGDTNKLEMALAQTEMGVQKLIGQNANYELSNKQLAEETANYDKVLQQLGLSLSDVNKLMGDGVATTTGVATISAEAAAKAKKDQDKMVADTAAAVKNIKDLQLSLIEDPFEQQREQLKEQTRRNIADLLGTPEQVAIQTSLLKDTLLAGMMQIDEAEAAAAQVHAESMAQKDQAALDARLNQLTSDAERRALMLELEFSTRENAESEHENRLYELKQAALDERLQLLIANGQAETAIAREIADEKLTNEIAHNKARLENEKALSTAKQQLQATEIKASEQAMDLGIAILQMDINARKKANDQKTGISEAQRQRNRRILEAEGIAAKSFAVGKIFVDLFTEIGGYMASPESIATLGVSGGILSGLATARAALAVAKVSKQEFANGTLLTQRAIGRFSAGIPDGPRHGHGGIKLLDGSSGMPIGEMEGGEPIMILSRNVYANNRDVVDRLLYSSLYQDGAPIFERGTVITSGNQSSTTVMQSNGIDLNALKLVQQPLVDEMRGMRADFMQFKANLKAYIVFSDIQEASDLEASRRSNSAIS